MSAERGLSKVETITGAFVWATKSGGTTVEVPIAGILLDGTNIAEPEALATEMADNIESQDGIKWNGNIRAELGSAGIPAENTAFWLKVTPHSGNVHYYGGAAGCIGRVLETGLRSLASGRAYVDLAYQFIAATSALGIKE